MFKKIILYSCLLTLLSESSFSQNSFTISSGTHVVFAGNAQMNLLNTDFINDGVFQLSAGDGTVLFSGNANANISGAVLPQFDVLTVAKTGGSKLILQRDINAASEINFTSGLLELNQHNIILINNAVLNGETEASHITGSTGGYVQTTHTVNAPSSENPGNLGAIITSPQNLGSTIIRRGLQSQMNTHGSSSSILRYFDIIPTNNTSLNATLGFHYLDAELNGLDENTLVFFSSDDNTNWVNTGFDSRDVTANNLTKTGINDFSRWTLSTPDGALPVIFGDIHSICNAGDVKLFWQTELEENTSRFDVQESRDGINWQVAGSVVAAGQSAITKHYSFSGGGSGDNLYRVALYDLNGIVHYSPVIHSACVSLFAAIHLYPNPAANKIWVSLNLPADAKVNLSIYSMEGKFLSRSEQHLFKGSNLVELRIEKLPADVFQLRAVWGDSQVQTANFIKK